MDLIEKLWAIEEIKQLKARYFRFMDGKDWAGMRTIFTDDATFDARTALSIEPQGGEDAIVRGGEAIAAFIEGAVTALRTTHHGHCHEITIDGPDDAHGVIAMEDIVWTADHSTLIVHGTGHYHEHYRRVDGAWRIARSRLTRLDVKTG